MVFYSLERDDRYPDVWYNSKVKHFKKVVCPQYNGHQRGARDEGAGLSVEVKKKKIGDLVSTVYSDWLITDRVAALFKGHGLTGYTLKPVDVCNMTLPYKLWELVATGKADYDPACGIKEIYRCEYCGVICRRHYSDSTGIMIDGASWDGNDFFIIEPYPKFIFTTEKVKELIEGERLKGGALILSTELRHGGNMMLYDEDYTKEQWKEYFERDITPLKDELKRKARESRERWPL